MLSIQKILTCKTVLFLRFYKCSMNRSLNPRKLSFSFIFFRKIKKFLHQHMLVKEFKRPYINTLIYIFSYTTEVRQFIVRGQLFCRTSLFSRKLRFKLFTSLPSKTTILYLFCLLSCKLPTTSHLFCRESDLP